MIQINGENGGGQVLRTALTLAMVTGKAFRMTQIRGLRSKPGLMRQHLTCVNAACEVSGGAVDGAEMLSTELVFKPGEVKAGDYTYRIGTAGSTTLLFQTLMPALMTASSESQLSLHGGTHNPMAPSADFITRSFLPVVRSMGGVVELDCQRMGFAPAGGGCLQVVVKPCDRLNRFELLDRGSELSRSCEVVLANVRERVGVTELAVAKESLGWADDCFSVRTEEDIDGSGNVMAFEVAFENVVHHVTTHGSFNKSAGKVAGDGVKQLQMFLKSQAVVGPRLADQLLVPMALAGGGSLRALALTNHIKTNIAVIEQFMDVRFEVIESPGCVDITLR